MGPGQRDLVVWTLHRYRRIACLHVQQPEQQRGEWCRLFRLGERPTATGKPGSAEVAERSVVPDRRRLYHVLPYPRRRGATSRLRVPGQSHHQASDGPKPCPTVVPKLPERPLHDERRLWILQRRLVPQRSERLLHDERRLLVLQLRLVPQRPERLLHDE